MGLTGGIGAGKSAALEAFRRLGAEVLSADEVVSRIYRDPAVVAAVRERFGPGSVGVDGDVDRAALADLAFASPEGVAYLERLVHPRVGRERLAWQRAMAERVPPPRLLVCEVPLLFEAGLESQFDAVLVVTASDDVRRRRVEERGQDFTARSGRQMTEQEKIGRADRYFVNDGPLEALDAWVAERFAEFSA